MHEGRQVRMPAMLGMMTVVGYAQNLLAMSGSRTFAARQRSARGNCERMLRQQWPHVHKSGLSRVADLKRLSTREEHDRTGQMTAVSPNFRMLRMAPVSALRSPALPTTPS